jgi:hypothetical protein
MATRRTKNADSERLDDASLERVIALLEPKDGSKPGTKKDACAILGIAYNTTRLTSLIEKYKENKARDAARRAEKRGKPATEAEISYVISSYLEGSTVEAISNSLFRGPAFVKAILYRYSVPTRQSAHSYFKPEMVPEAAMRDTFAVGEKVYSMRYDSLAEIKSEFSPGVYSLFLLSEKWKQFCYQPAYELASLEHIRKMGIAI